MLAAVVLAGEGVQGVGDVAGGKDSGALVRSEASVRMPLSQSEAGRSASAVSGTTPTAMTTRSAGSDLARIGDHRR